MRATRFVYFAWLIAGCGVPAETPQAPADSVVPARASKKAAPDSLAGVYTLPAPASACGGLFNVNDDTQVAATAAALSLSQYIDGEDPAYSLFFTGTVGDIIKRPSADLIALGYTTVDRQIASYSENSTVFNFADYQYDMSLTDAEGLAQGPVETDQLTTDGKGGISFLRTYSDSEAYRCHFVAK